MKTLKLYELDGFLEPHEEQREVFAHFTSGLKAVNQIGYASLVIVAEAHGWDVKVVPI